MVAEVVATAAAVVEPLPRATAPALPAVALAPRAREAPPLAVEPLPSATSLSFVAEAFGPAATALDPVAPALL
jgi:hypothetical protein